MNNRNRHKINFRRLLNVIGGLLLVEAVFMCIPTAVAAAWSDPDFLILLSSTIVTALTGCGLRMIKASSTRMGKREGYLLTASVWIVFSLFGALPFIFGSSHLGFTRAFFEAMSGFTTTGTTAINPATILGKGLHLWQGLMQWVGGMGIIIFTLAIIPALNNSGGMLMYNAESTGITHDKLRPRISQTARTLWGIYTGLTLLCALLLWAGPLDLYDSVCYAFGTLSTGGFSPTGEAPTAIGSWYVTVLVTLFMFLGGVNFGLIFKAFTGAHKAVFASEVLRLYVIMISVFSLIFIAAACISDPVSVENSILNPVFQVVSVITSTGYSVASFPYGMSFIMAVTVVMMFTGPCAGSTGGGVKLDRVLVLVKSISEEIKRIIRPNSVETVRAGGKVVPQHLVQRTVTFLSLFGIIAFVGGVCITLCGVPLESAMMASLSCICNTGFAPEIAGYSGQFYIMTNPTLWILAFLMLVGRLEVFTILLLFSHSFWK